MITLRFERFIRPEEERLYFTLPFDVPENIERMEITYEYPRHVQTVRDGVTYDEERNIIDLALTAGDGEYVGASGSDRTHIVISSYESSQGYTAMPVVPGTWEIIVGAYKIQPEGVTVKYTVELYEKTLRRYIGDTHMHTKGSDGVMTSEELVELCRQQHLDFAFITNHNNYSENFCLPRPADMTVIPGTEWTHYKGHAGFLGVQRPYRTPFCVNTPEQARAVIEEARAAGAMIVYNHPFCSPECGWKWGFDLAPFDAVEIWNGPLMLANENTACLEWWHGELCRGRKIPVTGGSDFHSLRPMALPGIPSTCVFAMSRSPEDILTALRGGHGYVKMDPKCPDMEARAGDAILGDTAKKGTAAKAEFTGLRSGDVVRTVSDLGVTETVCPPQGFAMTVETPHDGGRFVRYEVLRPLAKGMPAVRVLVSNPIYYE
ncbi:MAG: CehA/McbA family metallohydrolase [Clostridia bacterium]|nr:CehA/McbA family metallohydrolase [Clostridia bacterium]